MKKFKDFFEVLEPQAKGEKDFKDMHTKAVIDPGYPHHPDNKKIFSGEIKEEVELDEKYDLHHKSFSDAMQHAYDYAKKKLGITVDPKEIDDKVATGPKKPSEGKTNSYRLKGKGGNLQIQVYNKGGSKPFELNMYKEEVELDEAVWDDVQKIAKNKSAKKVKFDNGETTMIDAFSASAIVKMMPKLNPQNQEKAKKAMGKSPEMFLKLMNVAFGDKK